MAQRGPLEGGGGQEPSGWGKGRHTLGTIFFIQIVERIVCWDVVLIMFEMVVPIFTKKLNASAMAWVLQVPTGENTYFQHLWVYVSRLLTFTGCL
jgi:hypothetical protein